MLLISWSTVCYAIFHYFWLNRMSNKDILPIQQCSPCGRKWHPEKHVSSFSGSSSLLHTDLVRGWTVPLTSCNIALWHDACVEISFKPPSKEPRTCICSPCSFVSKDRPPETDKQRTLGHEMDHHQLFLGLGILQHYAVATTKFGFIDAAKKRWAAPNIGQWKWHGLWQGCYQWKCQLEMAPGFPNVSAGGVNWGLLLWLFWVCSNILWNSVKWTEWRDKASGFRQCQCWIHRQQRGVWGRDPGLCPSSVPATQGSPWHLLAEAARDRSGKLHVNYHLPAFLVSTRKTKEDNLRIQVLHCQKTQKDTICPPCPGCLYQ